MNAATKAVRASLVFIYRYPRNFKVKKLARTLFLGITQKVDSILECFGPFSYLFRGRAYLT